jgi:hypothetical protein
MRKQIEANNRSDGPFYATDRFYERVALNSTNPVGGSSEGNVPPDAKQQSQESNKQQVTTGTYVTSQSTGQCHVTKSRERLIIECPELIYVPSHGLPSH